MAGSDMDDFFERIVTLTALLWGPFYAIFYIARMLWREIAERREED